MKLVELKASKYRSIRQETIAFGNLNVFIGANASGKSTVLDALRFLQEGVITPSFRGPVAGRGGFYHLAWKGETAQALNLEATFTDGDCQFIWKIELSHQASEFSENDFSVKEQVYEVVKDKTNVQLLSVDGGRGWWLSGNGQKIGLEQRDTECGMYAASADATFRARKVRDFVQSWGLFDLSPHTLRDSGARPVSYRDSQLHHYGRNFVERLYALQRTSPQTLEKIVKATKSVLGVPDSLEAIEIEGCYYLLLQERGLISPVSHRSASSGTVQVLALMTALFEEPGRGIVAIEEPENNIHPAALGDLIGYLTDASNEIQIIVTTHSPILLDFLEDPSSVSVVRRDDAEGTKVIKESNPEGVKKALEESGFSLGEHHQVRGFGW